jgi:hypothetical protein
LERKADTKVILKWEAVAIFRDGEARGKTEGRMQDGAETNNCGRR